MALLHMSLQKDEKTDSKKMDHFVYKRTPDENCTWDILGVYGINKTMGPSFG
jgi:hypothetical protein